MLLLTSCVTVPAPPAQYLDDCSLTYLGADQKADNAQLLRLASDREFDMRVCNLDKRSLRAWYDGYCEARGWFCKWERRTDDSAVPSPD